MLGHAAHCNRRSVQRPVRNSSLNAVPAMKAAPGLAGKAPAGHLFRPAITGRDQAPVKPDFSSQRDEDRLQCEGSGRAVEQFLARDRNKVNSRSLRRALRARKETNPRAPNAGRGRRKVDCVARTCRYRLERFQ